MATEDPAALQVPSQDVEQRKRPSWKGKATPGKEEVISGDTRRLETDRIITVLDETMAKLEMSSLIPHIVDSLDRFADVLGPEITDCLIQHQKLCFEMEQLLGSPEGEASMRSEEQEGWLCQLEERLSRSVRAILRLMLANPSLCQALELETWARKSPAEGFLKAFGQFRNFVIERLLTSPGEEEGRLLLMENISLQIQQSTEASTALQAELAAVSQAGEQEMHKKDQEIQDLKTSMQDLAKDSKAGIQQIEQEGDRQRENELQSCQAKCGRLQEGKEQLGAQLSALILQHRASELDLKQRKHRLETEILKWMQKYKTDMGEKQAEYEEVAAAYSQEKAQLSLLREKRVVLLQEYSQIEEERRRQQEKEEAALEELNTKTLAATCIQAFWRGYLVRSLFSFKKKTKKGKGKGKGRKAKK
ncbi:dynein regulatory complex protein 10 isoform X2 [Melanerpes formicivorus]|uniref:dynein regulatory complex protein 10 isoform X2 n=1 Tax=Melanerpes formicivorus TaxID=211600 RepID=UPI00358F596C